jgi:SurA N-terminal domain
MQENNQKDGTTSSVPKVDEEVTTVGEIENPAASAVNEVVLLEAAEALPIATEGKKSWLKRYGFALLAIVVIGIALVFLLEREGRISTGIFSAFERNQAVARVNDVKIIKGDYDSSLMQLLDMATKKGADTTDPAIMEQIKTQTIDTLVNGELLRQAARTAGIEAPADAIDVRYEKIQNEVGGADVLATRMAEFDITEKSLRRDIENEILIEGLLTSVIDPNPAIVTDEEVTAFYDQAVKSLSPEMKAPPLEEVKNDIAVQIQKDRQNTKISEFLEKARSDAKIEILN